RNRPGRKHSDTPIKEHVTMSETHVTESATPVKPAKPYPEFPLFPHASRQWAKKIKGRMYYFGPWSDPQAALDAYLKVKDDLHAGRKPREDPEALTVKELCNLFLNAKLAKVDNNELSSRTWDLYEEAAEAIIAAFGKQRLVI